MPNHCYQRVRVSGDKEIIAMLHNHLCNEGRFLDAIIPTPLEIWGAPDVDCIYGKRNSWYDWRLKNWDTKWEVVSFAGGDDNPFDIETSWGEGMKADLDLRFSDDKEAWFSFACWTAWSPPYAIWKKLMDMGLCVEAKFFDEGGCFVGRWADGIMKEWSPSDDMDETRRITDFVYGEEDYFDFDEDEAI